MTAACCGRAWRPTSRFSIPPPSSAARKRLCTTSRPAAGASRRPRKASHTRSSTAKCCSRIRSTPAPSPAACCATATGTRTAEARSATAPRSNSVIARRVATKQSPGSGRNGRKIASGRIAMRRVGPNSFTEIYFAGCNPSFIETSDGYVMIDSPQQPIDAVRWREQLEEKAPIRYLINTEPHGDHISGNAYFTKTTVVGQVKLQECFDRYLNAFGSLEDKRERYKQMDPDSVWLVGLPRLEPAEPDLHRHADPQCRQSHLQHHPS